MKKSIIIFIIIIINSLTILANDNKNELWKEIIKEKINYYFALKENNFFDIIKLKKKYIKDIEIIEKIIDESKGKKLDKINYIKNLFENRINKFESRNCGNYEIISFKPNKQYYRLYRKQNIILKINVGALSDSTIFFKCNNDENRITIYRKYKTNNGYQILYYNFFERTFYKKECSTNDNFETKGKNNTCNKIINEILNYENE